MDLPTCPACKQSVLDDDAVDCPFCGAPLKGGSAPARPAPEARGVATKSTSHQASPTKGGAASAAAVKAPSASSRPGKPIDDAPTLTPDDDPFGIDPTVAANAIPVSRQPGAGKTIEVTCPMCETKGFVSPKASGKQIKCCNPKCMVPLFTAPVLEKKTVVAPPPAPKKKIPWLYIGGGLAFAAVAVVCIIVINDPGTTEIPAPDYLRDYQAPSASAEITATGDEPKTGTSSDVKVDTARSPEALRQEITKQALARMVEVSRTISQERRPVWRRLAVTSFIYGNEPDKAREQLNLLEKSSNQSPWEGIPPLVNLAWRNAGSPDEFKKTVNEVVGLANKLPGRGRSATEAAVAVAPLLVVTGKMDAARQLLAKHHHSEPPLEQFAAATRIVIEDKSFDLDRTLTGRTVGNWQFPFETAVTLVLAAHGRWDEAHAWAGGIGDEVAKTEATTAWAESLLRDTVPVEDASGLERAVTVGRNFPAAGKARLLARLADVRFAQGDRTGAADLLGQAQEVLKSLPSAKPVIVEGIKPLLDLKLNDATALKQMALAAAEVAGVQARTGDARAWNNFQLSLQFLSAIGPALTPTQERRRQVDGDSNRVSAELARALALKGQDDIRRALTQYKSMLRDVEVAAATRFQSEIVVLKAAVDSGLHERVWELLELYEHKPAKERQPLSATFLSMLVAQRFADAGDKEKSEEITSATESRIDPSDSEVVKLKAEHDLQSGRISGCVDQLNKAITPNGHLHETVLRLASRLVVSGKFAEAVTFCHGITHDPSLQEESLFFAATLSARLGKGAEFWKLAKDTNLGAMEICAVGAGLIVGFDIESAK
jgi:hypothetical protein